MKRLPLVVLLGLAGCTQAPVKPVPTPAPVPAPAPEVESIRIAAVGDVMLGTDYPQNILPDDDGAGFLAQASAVLREADIAFGNLECTLIDGGEAVKTCTSSTSCFLFRTPTRYAAHLAAAGFDVMSLANNHAHDFGEEGRSSSMQALESHGIRHSGRAGDVASWEVEGLRVALIAFAPNIGAHMLDDYERAAALVARLDAMHDIVLVSFHGGAEGADATQLTFGEETYHGEPRGDVVRFARTVVDAGADLVLGHGPHVPRALEVHAGRLIAYSLGNFATYYGISVEGIKGWAPVLIARLDRRGRFLDGRIESMIQVRPGGPQPDPQRQAFELIRSLSEGRFFGSEELEFSYDGSFRVTDVSVP